MPSENIIAWDVGGTLDEQGNTVVDPNSVVRFPLVFDWDHGLLTMINEEGLTIEFNGFLLPFRCFRVATTLDAVGNAVPSPWLNAKTICDEIRFYGAFLDLLGFCNEETGLLDAVGGSEFWPYGDAVQQAPTGVGTVAWSRTGTSIVATLEGSSLLSEEHNFGILLLDDATGIPVGLNQSSLQTETPESGPIESITLGLSEVEDPLRATLRAYLMVDSYPAASETLGP